MSALTEFFFEPVRIRRSNWSIIQWWEHRRPIYNLAVGAAGICTLAVAQLVAHLPPRQFESPLPVGPILVYAFLANLFYTAGPATDLLIRTVWGDDYAPIGPTLFRYGFVFSIGLTLLPIPLFFAAWLIRAFLSG